MSDAQAGFRVTGQVQGVGYRVWTQRTGTLLGLRGAVRNVRDGSVEVHVAGAAEAIAALEQQLSQGPPGARVDRVVRVASTMSIPSFGFGIQR